MGTTTTCEPLPQLPPDLRLHIISLLSPNEVALSGRLACKDAAQHFSQPPQRTACPSQPLPAHAATAPWCVEGAQAAFRELPFVRKLLLLSRAAGSGCEANVELAWQLLQPHVLPELLQTDHHLKYLRYDHAPYERVHSAHTFYVLFKRYTVEDVGTAAVAAGAVHLVPSLEQRCPGLLDPGRTLEAAAEHCSLAELQAVCELLGERMRISMKPISVDPPDEEPDERHWQEDVREVWYNVLAAAARSPTPDAAAKMQWVLRRGGINRYTEADTPSRAAVDVLGAAVSTGDMARVQVLQDHCDLHWCTWVVAQAVLQHAEMAFIERMGQAWYFLPSPESEAWKTAECVFAAATACKDAVAKLRLLADRGASLEDREHPQAVEAAAGAGNLEAVQFLLERERVAGAPQGANDTALLASVLSLAVKSGSIRLVSWLRQQGAPLEEMAFVTAARKGDLPMVRWLLEAGCPRGAVTLGQVAGVWPIGCTTDGERLLEAVRLLAAAGWPAGDEDGDMAQHPLVRAAYGGQPHSVWRALREVLPAGAREVPWEAATSAARRGCVATLEALAEMGVFEGIRRDQAATMYGLAAKNGDRGALECLLRLGVPLGEGAITAAAGEWAPLPCLQWLEGQGAAIGPAEAAEALERFADRRIYPGLYGMERMELEVWLRGRLGDVDNGGGR